MKTKAKRNQVPGRALLLAGLLTLTISGSAFAVEIDLKAESRIIDMADGQSITIWGYGLLSDAQVASPGPVLEVPPGDDTLIIHLTNNLAVPTSIVIPGLPSSEQPVKFTDSQGRARVRAFAHETDPGQVGTYTWTGVKAGSYLYRSGSHVAVQGQMGLFGALKVDQDVGVGADLGVAYPGVGYENEALAIFSELDPGLHAAVASGDYGPSGSVKSTVNYAPKYFLLNGAASPDASLILHHPVEEGERVLIRFFNAGLKSHAATVTGHRLQAVAEDGLQKSHPLEQVSILLAAGQTSDAVLTAETAGSYSLFDRRLYLSDGTAGSGGMAAKLDVFAAAAPVNLAASLRTMDQKPRAAAQLGQVKIDAGLALRRQAVSSKTEPSFEVNRIVRLDSPAALMRVFFGLWSQKTATLQLADPVAMDEEG